MRCMVMTICAAMASALLAAPKSDSVAEGYPDWQGVSAKNYIRGRELFPSDLRHKVTVVLEVDVGEKLQSQLVTAVPLLENRLTGFGENWETLESLPRDKISLVVCWGGAKKPDLVRDALKSKDQDISRQLTGLAGETCSFYDGVTFTGAPETAGKRPYIYVMGPEGAEPLFKGELNAASVKEAKAAMAKAKKTIAGWETKWRPFYGNIAEPKFNTSLAKALEKGKTAKLAPLEPIAKTLLADVKSKDPEKAKESQILYDALQQTRSDLVMRIKMEAGQCPHRALYDIQELVKYWPMEKKRLEAAYVRIKANPEAEPLAKMFCKLMEWSKPEFTCKNTSEAKKIVQELNKMKKTLEKLKESKTIVIQNGALIVDMKVDELIAVIPTKVPAK